MSTTFDVYPGRKELPTFAEVVGRSTAELHRFLDSVGVSARPPVHVRLQRCADDTHLPFSPADEVRWGEDVYAWFMVGDVPGGTDAYFTDSPDEIREYWKSERGNPRYRALEPVIRESMRVGHAWSFRRSVGQRAVTNIAYGLIAASLASLTDGVIHSIDSAWGWERLPALPEDFLSWYFRPEQAIAEDSRSWARTCIAALPEELQGRG